MGLSINDSVYSSIFFFLTGLHFFHLVVGLLLLSLLSWSCSFSSLTGLLQLQEEDLIEEEDCKRQDNERNVVNPVIKTLSMVFILFILGYRRFSVKSLLVYIQYLYIIVN